MNSATAVRNVAPLEVLIACTMSAMTSGRALFSRVSGLNGSGT